MTDERLDFSALDPTTDAAEFEQRIQRVMRVAGGELALRRARGTVAGQIGRWQRPMLLAAASLILLAIGALVQLGESPQAVAGGTLAEAAGVPQQLAQWLGGQELPGPSELLSATYGGQP